MDDKSDKTMDSGQEMEYPKLAHDLSKKIRSTDVIVEGEDSSIDFSGLHLSEAVLKGLLNCGFQKPSPIQLKSIPLGRCGFDLLLQAKSGTGKTCVFSVIALEDVAVDKKYIQALIVAPSREIAFQNSHVLKTIGTFKDGVRVQNFIGGTSVAGDVRNMMHCNIAVGTPGRIVQLITEYQMDLSNTQLVVLDEADKLLEESFFSELQTIFGALPSQKQVIAASATYPDGLDEFIVKFMKNPMKVQLDSAMPVLVAIEQFAVNVRKMTGYVGAMKNEESFKNQYMCLMEILRRIPYTQVMIFSTHLLKAEKLYDALKNDDMDAVLLSGTLAQKDRLESLYQLQEGKCKIMVATDLAARGIDSESVDLVINFDVPYEISTYIHRIGRAGRFGTPGIAISLLTFRNDWSTIAGFQGKVNLNLRVVESVQQLDLVTSQSFNVKALSTIKYQEDNETYRKQPEDSWKIWEYCLSIGGDVTRSHEVLLALPSSTDDSTICETVTRNKLFFRRAKEAAKKKLEDTTSNFQNQKNQDDDYS